MGLALFCSRPVAIAVALSLALTSLGGCADMATNNGLPPLAIDPADPCAAERAAFNNSPYFMRDTIARTTATGAIAGGLGGALIGGLAGGGRGALIGLAAGALVGAAAGYQAGYWQQLQQNAQDQATLANNYNQDITTTGTNIDHTSVAFIQLRTCRFAQAAQIKSLARRKIMPREVAVIQLTYERDRFGEEIQMARGYGVNMAKQADQFQYASEQIHKAPQASAQSKIVSAETIPEKRRSFETTLDKADASSKVAFDLDSTAKVTS